MSALLGFILSNPTILAIGAGVIAVAGAWFKGRLSGAKAERNAQKAKEADAYAKHLQDIQNAANARSSVDAGRLPDRDPYKRD
ncbi:ABC transporter permease [Mesorhizobium temperatum]|uniref:Uncharacterized protein n=1 Tax=Mesorhizobium temperatum TaxID=241416 RepID=A0A271LHD0_9HYPH|nr:ABC transporter permease [Mesorhizobium temperatum]PAQ06785.1 hypothetical protein CIT26_23620 [Mesorhizobium temperatum]